MAEAMRLLKSTTTSCHLLISGTNTPNPLGQRRFPPRFGRDPEGMWLAETAVDYATLEALIAEGTIHYSGSLPGSALPSAPTEQRYRMARSRR